MGIWNEWWQEESTPTWHHNKVNKILFNHHQALLSRPKRRILVPLCGKSLDLKWLYDAGHTVVGIEGVEQPICEFYAENSIQYNVEQFSWGKLYKSKDDRLQIYCCDIFQLDESILGKFDAVWDRAALVAIYEEDRESYVELMKSLLAPDFRYLVTVLQRARYTDEPPFSISVDLTKELFGNVCQLEVLELFPKTAENEYSITVIMMIPK